MKSGWRSVHAGAWLLLAGAAVMLVIGRNRSNAAGPPDPAAASVLIRFGTDGQPDVDWSGNLSAPPGSQMAGWQFDGRDQLTANSWKCATRGEVYWDTPYERNLRPTSTRRKVTEKGIVLSLTDPRSEVRVHTAQGDFSFTAGPDLWLKRPTFLNGRASISAAPPASQISSGQGTVDYPSLLQARDGTLWIAWQSWSADGDQILVRRRRNGNWSEPQAVAGPGGDFFRTALAEDGAGRIWIVWSSRVAANYDLYARAFDGKRWSSPQRLTTAENSDIFHTLAADSNGKLYLAWQSARAGNFDIYLRVFDGRKWSSEIQVSSDPGNDWDPALAVAPDGRVTILWDTYARGNYDIVSRTFQNGKLGDLVPIAQSVAMEIRPSAQFDQQGRLWVAWDEGDANWGKDFGYQIPESGRGLLDRRQVRVGVIDHGQLFEPRESITAAVPEDLRQVFHQPALMLDREGNPWVFFRVRVNLPQGKGESHRALWRLAATCYRNGHWSPMIEFPAGFGRIDSPGAAALQPDGSISVVWESDGRTWQVARPGEQNLYLAAIPSAPQGSAADLTAFRPPTEPPAPSHSEEAADVARIRNYRATPGEQTLRIMRGDIHRHTDVSWDGNRDGSLIDSYRYALDAAAFDYLGVCDHQNGKESPYDWRMLQRAVDLFTIQGKFTPLYSYERSLPYPNGHRNVLFADRGRPLLPTSDAEQQGTEGAGNLYAYLRKFGGFTASHTSASVMGTDWRDNDSEVEPVVEIYQGYRSNFESTGAPRAPAPKESERYSAGYVWNAWAKGFKLGVQSSSDHVSTHISYACFYVDEMSRHGIVRAAKARHSYAATDNIVLDVRMGDHFMGDIFRTRDRLPLIVRVSGTGPVARAEVIRNNRVVYSASGTGAELRFTYTDADRPTGDCYYYVRVEQQNGQLAWSSPIWVRYE